MSTPSASAPAVVVVGAGVIGLAIALRLACAGRAVTVIDRQAPGRGCSYGNAGRIANECVAPLASPQTLRDAAHHLLAADGPLSIRARYAHRIAPWLLRFAFASRPRHFASGVAALASLQRQSLPAFQRLVDDADCRKLLQKRGHVVVSERGTAEAELRAQLADLKRHGIVASFLSRNDLRQLAPGLSGDVACGLYFPDSAHVVDPYRLCRALARAIDRHGGRLVSDEVRAITPQADGTFVLDGSGQRHVARRLVLAAGAWSRPLARQLGVRLPLDTERGYSVTVKGFRPDLNLPVESLERRTVMTPLADGLRITGFVEFGGLELPAVAARYTALRRHLDALLPGAERSAASEWMGFRPSLPDHLPVIGRSRKHPNAILACGHQHLGLTLCAVTAEIVEALLLQRPPPVEIAPFRGERFG